MGDVELTITEIYRKKGVVYLRTEFSSLVELNLNFIKSMKFSTPDGTAIKSREGTFQTSTFKAGKKDRWGYILRWELTTEETQVAVDHVLFDKPQLKRYPFKVTAPLSKK